MMHEFKNFSDKRVVANNRFFISICLLLLALTMEDACILPPVGWVTDFFWKWSIGFRAGGLLTQRKEGCTKNVASKEPNKNLGPFFKGNMTAFGDPLEEEKVESDRIFLKVDDCSPPQSDQPPTIGVSLPWYDRKHNMPSKQL